MSPSLKNNISIESKLQKTNDCLTTAVSKIMSSDGGWLNLHKCGVQVFVPDGAIDNGERELFSVEVTNEEWCTPILQEGDIIFSYKFIYLNIKFLLF